MYDICLLLMIRDVHIFLGIGDVIIENRGDRFPFAVRVFTKPEAAGSNRVTVLKAPDGGWLPTHVGVVKQRHEAATLKMLRRRQSGEFAQRWIDVDRLRQPGRLLLAADTRGANDKRNPH